MIDLAAGAAICNQCFKQQHWRRHRGADVVVRVGLQPAVAELAEHLGIAPATVGHTNGKSKIVATYNYVDEQGKLLYQVVRYDPKDFRQRRPIGSDKWDWECSDRKSRTTLRLVPYRLPDLLAAGDRGVLVVEGEKDADRAAGIGIIATTCAMGAGKWRPEYNEHFRGRSVYIVPDNDSPGREHAQQVAQAFTASPRASR